MAKRSPLKFNSETVHLLNENNSRTVVDNQTSMRANKKGRDGRRFIAAHVSHEAIKQIGLLSVQQDRTKQDLLVESLNDLFAKYGLSRIAE